MSLVRAIINWWHAPKKILVNLPLIKSWWLLRRPNRPHATSHCCVQVWSLSNRYNITSCRYQLLSLRIQKKQLSDNPCDVSTSVVLFLYKQHNFWFWSGTGHNLTKQHRLTGCHWVTTRGRPKVEIHFRLAVTESRPKVMYHIRPKSYVPPKVKRDFRPKTETESQSYLSRHDYRSQQVPPSVRCLTIACIWYLSHLAPSCQPCSVWRVSLMTLPQGPTVPDADADNAATSSV